MRGRKGCNISCQHGHTWDTPTHLKTHCSHPEDRDTSLSQLTAGDTQSWREGEKGLHRPTPWGPPSGLEDARSPLLQEEQTRSKPVVQFSQRQDFHSPQEGISGGLQGTVTLQSHLMGKNLLGSQRPDTESSIVPPVGP